MTYLDADAGYCGDDNNDGGQTFIHNMEINSIYNNKRAGLLLYTPRLRLLLVLH